jgi:hypothetical protein
VAIDATGSAAAEVRGKAIAPHAFSMSNASAGGAGTMRSGSAQTTAHGHRSGAGRRTLPARPIHRLLAAMAIALITLLAAAFTTLVDASSPNAPTVEFRAAERTLPDGAVARTPLPDLHRFAHPSEAPQQVRYRMAADLGDVKPHAQAVYFPGLRAPAHVSINGHVVQDELRHLDRPAPRSIDAIRLIRIPDEFLRAGSNEIELIAGGRTGVDISRVWLGRPAPSRRCTSARSCSA